MRLGVGIGVLLVVAACAGPPGEDPPTTPSSDSPFISATFEVGRVHGLNAGARGIWTANYEEGTVTLIDPERNEVTERIDVRDVMKGLVTNVVPDGDDVWLFAHDSSTIGHLDPRTLDVTFGTEVKPSGFIDEAVASKDIWLAQYSGGRYLEPTEMLGKTLRSANVVVPPPGEKYSLYSDIAAGPAGVWAVDESQGTLAAIAPTTGEPRVVATKEEWLTGGYADVVVGHGYVWVMTSSDDGTTLARYDDSTGEVETTSFRGDTGILKTAAEGMWLFTHEENEAYLYEVDPETLDHSDAFVMEGEFLSQEIAYGFGSLWIPHDTNLMTRVDVEGGTHPSESPSPPERRGDAEVCDNRGPWVYCSEALWMRRVALDAGLEELRDTGTAYEFAAGERRIFVWNALPRPVAELAAEGYEPVPGTDAYTDGQRIAWEAQGLHIYISSADGQPIDTLPDDVLARLIDSSKTVPMSADLEGAKPQPTPTATQRYENVGDRVRVWPVTEDVANEGKYLFTAPHCGLDWMLDFDGTFWDAIEPDDYGDGENYSFFYNSDEGAITFTGDDTAVYQASTGEKVRLERLEGPIVVDPCA